MASRDPTLVPTLRPTYRVAIFAPLRPPIKSRGDRPTRSRNYRRRAALVAAILMAATSPAAAQWLRLSNPRFELSVDSVSGGVMRLTDPTDPNRLNYVIGSADDSTLAVLDSRWLGDLIVRYRVGKGPWRFATTGHSADTRRIERTADAIVVRYSGESRDSAGLTGIIVTETYRLTDRAITWTVALENASNEPVEIGDLGLPLLFNTHYARNPQETYERRVVRHSYIAGDNSFILLTRGNGVGPFLLITPRAGTHLEYFDRAIYRGSANADTRVFGPRPGWEGLWTAYIHASVQATVKEPRGTWNQPLTNRTLAPAGQDQSAATYAFTFQWVDDYVAARRALVETGLLDVQVAPGMVVPRNLSAMVSIGSQDSIESLAAQYPDQTTVEPVPAPDPKRRNWRLTFRRLGENLIRVRWGGGRETTLEYFVTQPLDTIITKRAAFIAKNQQVRGTDKWYEGEFSLWDMKESALRTPDSTGGLHRYTVSGSDDPDLSKAPYIASKNVIYPDAKEVAAVEYYLEHFVWGKLQRTGEERPFPYGIYGTPDWKTFRDSPIGYNSGGIGKDHMWRTFDYTHLIQLYYQMFKIASFYPDLVHYLDADGYLERAYRTAMAFFEVPYNIKMGEQWDFHGWTDWAYKQGAFHELYIPPLIDALARRGRTAEATKLRLEWEKKVKYFLYDHPYPFGSEMYFDATAFQSTQAIARYAIDHVLRPDTNLWRDKNSGVVYSHPSIKPGDAVLFMERSLAANLADRGWLETNYYQLGSDYRQEGNSDYLLSYMTQMGGTAFLDYALHASTEESEFMRLGFASYLGSWALVNAGTEESGYGYWYRGRQNDGAASWAFKPEKYGPIFADATGGSLDQGRGGWRVDGEIDNGFSDALLFAATIVVDDPIFGLIGLGGDLTRVEGGIALTPKDGVGQRVFVRTPTQRIDLVLDRDGFDATAPMTVASGSNRVAFTLENRYRSPHRTTLRVAGLTPGRYRLRFGRTTRQLQIKKGAAQPVILSVGAGRKYRVLLERIASR